MKFSCILLLFLLPGFIADAQHAIKPSLDKGILNLENTSLEELDVLELDGEWEFYLSHFYSSSDFLEDSLNIYKSRDYLHTPGMWNTQTYLGKPIPAFSYGTYRTKIRLDKVYKELSLKIMTIPTAFELYVDGELLLKTGSVSKNVEETIQNYDPKVVTFRPEDKEVEIILWVSNYNFGAGGVLNQLYFGIPENVRRYDAISLGFNFFIAGAILLMGLYHLGLYYIRRTEISLLFFALFCITNVVRILNTNEYIMRLLFPDLPWDTLVRLEYIGFYPSVVFFDLYVFALFPLKSSKWIIYSLWISLFVFLGFDFLSPILVVSYLYIPLQILSVFFAFPTSYAAIRAIFQKEKGIWIFMVGFSVLWVIFMYDILQSSGIYHLMGLGVFIFVFSQAYLLSIKIDEIYQKNLQLNSKLTDVNQNLEKIVEERTQELKESKDEIIIQNEELWQTQEEIQAQRDFLERQNAILAVQNKKIESSIHSAQTIQQALFDYETVLAKLPYESFFIYRPRDVVSGDFFWLAERGNKMIIVLADCTGHGVEGAFMTLISKSLLDKIILISGIDSPANILTCLHEEISIALRQKQSGNNRGLDAVVLLLEKNTDSTRLVFSGAKNNLFYKSPLESFIQEMHGARKAIGGFQNEELKFIDQELLLPQGSLLYLGSDGFQDQCNVKRKSFGKDKLKELILENAQDSLPDQKKILERVLDEHMQGTDQRDDILLVGIRL